jgi:hypothetical protein
MGVMGEDWKQNGHLLLKAAALFACAVSILFWLPALLSFALVAAFQEWVGSLARAVVLVAGIYFLLAVLLALGGYFFWRRLEAPTASAKRRLSDHIDWWQGKIFNQDTALNGGEDDAGE